ANLAGWLTGQGITVWHSTPTLLRVATTEFAGVVPQSVRLVVLGGEEALRRDLERVREHFGKHCVAVNGYGPTESTVSLQYFISPGMPLKGDRIPIGRPVESTQVVLLSAEGEETDFVGELGIRSRYVALGYWKDEAQTRRVFNEDTSGTRLYRTGDLVRYLGDGTLEYLGRADQQVKIRGYRVELGEIEAALLEHARVGQAVVVLRGATDTAPGGGREAHPRTADGRTAHTQPDSPGEARLVGYVVERFGEMGREGSVTVSELREHLRRKLPEYMVPAVLMIVPQLPMNANGKADRWALPPPDVGVELQQYVAPRTPLEAALAGIWGELFRLPRIGIHDDFFQLGGHSVLAMRLVSRIRQVLAIELPLRSVFENPTLLQLSVQIEQGGELARLQALLDQVEAMWS